MFLDEARLAAGIHHPNVVPILEVGASDRGYYLAMEYIEGDTLARLLARAASASTPLPIDIGLRIIIDMLMGLHAAHELRDEKGDLTELVHRDVSPQNVLVGVDGISRISDFGVAHAATRLTATRSGQLKGKIAYMAPEQAAGQPVDRRADVFAGGVVLWEVLVSKRLFKAENEAATLQRVLTAEIQSPRDEVLSVPVEVAEVCLKALERDPEKRFATCAQFADALERATAVSLHARVARPKDVAAYVIDVIGQEIHEQREAVRAWSAFSEPSQMGQLPSSPSSATGVGPVVMSSIANEATVASGVIRQTPLPPPRRRLGLVAGAATFLLVVAALVFFLYRPSEVGAGDAATSLGAPPVEVAGVESAAAPRSSSAAGPAVSGEAPPLDSAPAADEAPSAAPSVSAAPTTRPPPNRRYWSLPPHDSDGDDFLRNPYR